MSRSGPASLRDAGAAGRTLLGAALAGALAIWFLRRIDLAAVGTAMTRVAPGWVALAALFQVGALTVRGWRWRTLLAARAPVPLADALAATYMGWVALVLLPARVGELARPWLLDRRHRCDRSFAFGAQQLERGLDLVLLVAWIAAYLAFAAVPGSAAGAELHGGLARAEHLLAALAVVAVVAVAVALLLAPRLEAALTARWGERGGRLAARARSFLHGLTALRSRQVSLAAACQSVLLWTAVAATHWSLFRAFGLALPGLAVAPVMAAVVLGALVPTPAGVGSYHAAVQTTLTTLLGVDLATASAYAVVGHAVAYLPNLVLGGTLLVRSGLRLGQLSARREPAAVDVEAG